MYYKNVNIVNFKTTGKTNWSKHIFLIIKIAVVTRHLIILYKLIFSPLAMSDNIMHIRLIILIRVQNAKELIEIYWGYILKYLF